MLQKEWFSAAELAALQLPYCPHTERGLRGMAEVKGWQRPEWEGRGWRRRTGRGGGVEYHYSVLSLPDQTALGARVLAGVGPVAPRKPVRGAPRVGDAAAQFDREQMWKAWGYATDAKKEEAARRMRCLDLVEMLERAGTTRLVAMEMASVEFKVSRTTIYAWFDLVAGVGGSDRAAFLLPQHRGRVVRAAFDDAAWEFAKADYLRPEQPNVSDCYRRLQAVAAEKGWQIPSERTLCRKLRELPHEVRVLAREGADALKRMYPAQERDRTALHALAAVNADGHKWDVFVRWPDGTVARPMMISFQDIYSGKILAWRVDRTENKETFRLCFGDMVEAWGIPGHCVLDNSRSFASKWMTGGTPNRFRFKVRDEEPLGVMTQLGVEVHWATPYAGQSKPIERAFRDLAQGLAKHPKFAGAYTGNNPTAKPDNYGDKAVPLELFQSVLAQGIAEHNAREGRTGGITRGRSFDAVYAESVAHVPVTRPTADQRWLWLLAAERVTVRAVDGSIMLAGNRFWHKDLHKHLGEKLTVRFDPDALQGDLHVYLPSGRYVCAAACLEAVGFFDAKQAREHAATRKAWMRGVKMQLEAERKLSIREVADMLPKVEAPEPEYSRVIRPMFSNTAPVAMPIMEEDEPDQQRQVLDALARANAARRGGALRVVRGDDEEVDG